MPKKTSYIKLIVVDLIGFLLIIVALLIGWLPGPGGLPLFLAGLAMLASNHSWAEKWMDQLKERGNNLADFIFRDNTYLKFTYDLLAITMVILAVIFFGMVTNSFLRGVMIWLIALGLIILLMNRRRGLRLNRYFRRKFNY